MAKIIRTANDIQIPAIAPKKKKIVSTAMELNRQEWTKQYDYFLGRKNRLGLKLADKGRPTETNEKYQALDKEVKKYWQLLADSKPTYKP